MKFLVFLPGILGSQLFRNSERVWPRFSLRVGDVAELLDDSLTPGEPISRFGPLSFYESLIQDFANCGYSSTGSGNRQLISFGYDWRKPNAETAARLGDHLDAKLAPYGDDLEIILIGHSMGGLVLRHLLEAPGDNFRSRPWFPHISTLITLGTPHLGSPKAVQMLVGKDKYPCMSREAIGQLARACQSVYELVPPEAAAMAWPRVGRGTVPDLLDPFEPSIIGQLGWKADLAAGAKAFHESLDLSNRPPSLGYFFYVGGSHTTKVRSEWIAGEGNWLPIERKDSGDGTVPVTSAAPTGIPHGFSTKSHSKIFEDRKLRMELYNFLDAPANVVPFSASGRSLDEEPEDAIGLSVNQETYEVGEPIEVVASYKTPQVDPREFFVIEQIDLQTEDRTPVDEMNVNFEGVTLGEFRFTISSDLQEGAYELRPTIAESDDPAPTVFFVN